MRKLRFRKGREKAQDYINKWQERGSSPRLAQVQSPCLKCQQVLRLCQSKTQQTWTWTMVARGLPAGHCAGMVSGEGSETWGTCEETEKRGSRLSPAAPWPVWPWTSPWVKDSTNQAKTVVWAVIVAGERIWSFPTPFKNWTLESPLAHNPPNPAPLGLGVQLLAGGLDGVSYKHKPGFWTGLALSPRSTFSDESPWTWLHLSLFSVS